MTEIVVLIPVLARPHRVEPLLASLHESQGEARLRPFFLASPEDESELEALRASDADFAVVGWPAGRGDWARKINCGYRLTDEAWLLLGADDIAFTPGWADRALEFAEQTGARVIGTADGGGNGEVMRGIFSPHPLLARSYIEDYDATFDDTGEVVSESYSHNYPDRELAVIAQARGEWAFASGAVLEHLHPLWKKGSQDGVYEKGRAEFTKDTKLFRERLVEYRSKLPAHG